MHRRDCRVHQNSTSSRTLARGKYCHSLVPHGHWKTNIFITTLRLSGVTAPITLRGAIFRSAFLPAGLGSVVEAGRRSCHGQPTCPRTCRDLPCYRNHRRAVSLQSTLQPQLQADRDGILKDQSPPKENRHQNRGEPMDGNRNSDRRSHARRAEKLLRKLAPHRWRHYYAV